MFTISKNSSAFHSIQYFLNISSIFIFKSFIIGSRNTHFFSHNSTSLCLYQSKNSCKLTVILLILSYKKAHRQTKKTYVLFYGGNLSNCLLSSSFSLCYAEGNENHSKSCLITTPVISTGNQTVVSSLSAICCNVALLAWQLSK